MPTLEIRFTIYYIAELKRELTHHWHTRKRRREMLHELSKYFRNADRLHIPYYVKEEAVRVGSEDMDVIDSVVIWQYLTTGSVDLRLLV